MNIIIKIYKIAFLEKIKSGRYEVLGIELKGHICTQ